VSASHFDWHRSSFQEIEKKQRTRNHGHVRTFLSTAAVFASVFVPEQCNDADFNCGWIESAVRTAGAIGGTAAILSGLKKYSDARVHTRALKELSNCFKSGVACQAVPMEGRTRRLTATAEEQHCEWRRLLHELYLEDNGTRAAAGGLSPASPAADMGSGSAAQALALHPETASPVTLDSAH
jgi:hypothetical protein